MVTPLGGGDAIRGVEMLRTPRIVRLHATEHGARKEAEGLNVRRGTLAYGVARLDGYRRRPWAVTYRRVELVGRVAKDRSLRA